MSDPVPESSHGKPHGHRVGTDLWYRAMPSLLNHSISLAHLLPL